MKIQNTENIGVAITLKEITDLIEVEHNKAMKQVEKLTKEPSFGGVEKITTPTYNPNGSINRKINTYKLNKKQAIAVGAKLNNTLLMKLIDKIEEIEKKSQNYLLPSNYIEALEALTQSEKEKVALNSKLLEKDKIILAVADLNIKAGDVSIGDFAKNLSINGFGQNKLFKWLKSKGFLMSDTAPYQIYVERGYFTRKPSKEKHNGKYRYKTYLTPKGTIWLSKLLKSKYKIGA